ncbi:hypothetical protein R3P38DRAFT_3206546 [Favolaschia claudopus]|uniref:Uncharacterized protein n=1 Tax=Favolaschia claudopus TaxID=2862362 RepID=A0AAW0AMG1_9AGAR
MSVIGPENTQRDDGILLTLPRRIVAQHSVLREDDPSARIVPDSVMLVTRNGLENKQMRYATFMPQLRQGVMCDEGIRLRLLTIIFHIPSSSSSTSISSFASSPLLAFLVPSPAVRGSGPDSSPALTSPPFYIALSIRRQGASLYLLEQTEDVGGRRALFPPILPLSLTLHIAHLHNPRHRLRIQSSHSLVLHAVSASSQDLTPSLPSFTTESHASVPYIHFHYRLLSSLLRSSSPVGIAHGREAKLISPGTQ